MTAATSTNTTTFTTDETTHELIAERWFDAPRDLVFRAMTEPERIPRWWGRIGDVTRVETMDVRPGGTWRFVSRGPDGVDYPFTGEFLEIDPPSRVVQTFIFDVEGLSDHVSVVTTEYTEEGGRTWTSSSPRSSSSPPSNLSARRSPRRASDSGRPC